MKLIQTKDYLLLIDEKAEINCSDYWVYFNDNEEFDGIIIKSNLTEKEWYSKLHDRKSYKKVIAYYPLTKEAKELDLPLLPNPFEEVNIEKEFNSQYKNFVFDDVWEKTLIETAFKAGYKSAQSKQFSLEDMKDALNQLADKAEYGISNFTREDIITKIIQSLSTQQLPKEFILSDKFNTFEENLKNGKYKW